MESSAASSSSATASTPRRSPKTEPAQVRIVCPSARTGAVIGKGGSSVRYIQGVTGARIRLIDDPHVPPCEDRVIVISHGYPFRRQEGHQEPDDRIDNGEGDTVSLPPIKDSDDWGPVRKALVRVFEKIVKGDSEEKLADDLVVCGKLLVGASQTESVLGKGGKVLEKVRSESGAHHVRHLPREQIPPCALPEDELIQVAGSFEAVKKALLYISTCLQDEPLGENSNFSSTKPSGSSAHYGDYHSRSHHSNMGSRSGGHNRKFFEEEVVFKLLCHSENVGSLIGKGGCVVRSLENDTGATITMAEAIPDSDERVVVIAARENPEHTHSPAQEAVLRVHARLTELGFERGSGVVARLLIQPSLVTRLLGKGGQLISEMRQMTGAVIRTFPKEKAPKHGSQNDEIVHIVGNFQCVQDALFHITRRLREMMLPSKSPFSSSSSRNFSSFPDMHAAQYKPSHALNSPGSYHSPAGPYPNFDHQRGYSFGMELGHNIERAPFSHSSEKSGHGPPYDHSPRSWSGQGFGKGNSRACAVNCSTAATRSTSHPEGCSKLQNSTSSQVEVVVPQKFLSHVYGENGCTLNQIRQISGANVTVNDPKPGASEGTVVFCGTAEQMHTAQMLLHAFILCGHAKA